MIISPSLQAGEHSQQTWELSHVVKGMGIRTIGNFSERVMRGEVVLIPPGVPHCWMFDDTDTDGNGNIHNITLMFSPEVLKGIKVVFPEMAEKIHNVETFDDALIFNEHQRAQLSQLLTAMSNVQTERRLGLFIEILGIIGAPNNSTRHIALGGKQSRAEKKLKNLEIYCKCNFSRKASLQQAASYIGMNKAALCTFIKKHLNKTFTEYLNDFRLKHASELIRTTDSGIADVAYASGFESVTYFNKLFKLKYGVTPTEFKKTSQY